MRKLFLSAGHQSYRDIDPGAIANGVKEADLTTEFRNLLVAELKKLGIDPFVDEETDDLRGTVGRVISHMGNTDLAIDIHFNASNNSNAYGTEILTPLSASEYEKNTAKSLLITITSVLQTYARGIITEAQSHCGRLMFMRPNCENLLIEICFITNTSDLYKYQHNKETLAINLALTLSKLL